jgi:hypothetical protein
LQERGNNCTLRNHTAKTNPSNNKELDNNPASLPWSHHIRTGSSQNVNCANKPEFLPENEEGDSRFQVLPRFRRTTSIDIHNLGGIAATRQDPFPTVKKKLGISQAPRILLRKVLSRPEALIPLNKFSFLEDEIEFVDIIGEASEEQRHARIFRITAGERSFALKVASVHNSVRLCSFC